MWHPGSLESMKKSDPILSNLGTLAINSVKYYQLEPRIGRELYIDKLVTNSNSTYTQMYSLLQT